MNCTDYWYSKFGVHIAEGHYVMTYLVCLEIFKHVAICSTLFLCSGQLAMLPTCCSFPDLIFILCVWFDSLCVADLLQVFWPYFYTLWMICCVLQTFALFMTLFLYFVFDLMCVAVLMTLFLYFVFDLLCVAVLITLFLYFVLIHCVLQFWWPYFYTLCWFAVLQFWWPYFYTLCWFAVCCSFDDLIFILCVDSLCVAVLMTLFLCFVLICCVLQTFATGGLGSIMRVLTDRKRVWFYVLRCSLSRAVLSVNNSNRRYICNTCV